MSLDSLKGEIDKKNDDVKDDLFIIDESIKRIQEFVKALQKLQNSEVMDYTLDNKMIKI